MTVVEGLLVGLFDDVEAVTVIGRTVRVADVTKALPELASHAPRTVAEPIRINGDLLAVEGDDALHSSRLIDV